MVLFLYPNGFPPTVGKEFGGFDAECPPVGLAVVLKEPETNPSLSKLPFPCGLQ